ncbi:MAG: helix-turn-helix transcriptional regulator [Terracidiphilus sp.]|nr:helix-turn-helix transcriptional regulator [Terracidiphilus sp.]
MHKLKIQPLSKNSKLIFGATVRDLRAKMGYSQEMLAEKANLHRTYIGGIERGERNISLVNIVRLARALKVKPSQLLERI